MKIGIFDVFITVSLLFLRKIVDIRTFLGCHLDLALFHADTLDIQPLRRIDPDISVFINAFHLPGNADAIKVLRRDVGTLLILFEHQEDDLFSFCRIFLHVLTEIFTGKVKRHIRNDDNIIKRNYDHLFPFLC